MAKTTGYQRRWAGWATGLVLYYLMDEIDTVGASKLAKNVNDNAGSLTVRGALTFIVGTPPGASSLLQSQGRVTQKQTPRIGGAQHNG